MAKIRFLSAKDISSIFSMKDAIDAVREGFTALSSGRAEVPLRTRMDIKKHRGTALFMPVYIDNSEYLGLKVVNIYPSNVSRGLNAISALISLFNVETGGPAAVMDGEYLTALRTGAASGLATELLSREDSETLGIIGAGAQGRTQLKGVCQVRSIKRVFVFDVNSARAKEFAQQMKNETGIEIVQSNDKRDLKKCDIICTATTATSPVFFDNDISEGVHINAVGSYKPDMCEIPERTILRAKIVTDHKETCLKEAGDIIQPIDKGLFSPDKIYGDIGEIASGKIRGRESEGEITVFKSVGNAVQDLSAAAHVLKKAEKLNVGVEIDL